MPKRFLFMNMEKESSAKEDSAGEIIRQQKMALESAVSLENDPPSGMEQGFPRINSESEEPKQLYDLSLISNNVVIAGSISSSTGIEINGTVNGNVTCEEELVISGEINGDIAAKNLDLSGTVNGNVVCDKNIVLSRGANVIGNLEGERITCDGRVSGSMNVKEKVMILSNAEVSGDILSRLISVEEGAIVNGNLKITGNQPREKQEAAESPAKAETDQTGWETEAGMQNDVGVTC
ncbi:MAG TPA: polymer-forming cytoskeletal protein [Clostridia bacterium]|nr:polymer-forming cytoskeletal protein [Clostridia bacterium]